MNTSTLHRVLVALSLLLGAANAVDTLVIGDSYAEYGKTYWATYCGMTVQNEGAAGTTSVQWAAGDTMKDAYDLAPEATKILYIIGGNDYMGAACGPTRAELKATILLSLNKLKNLVTAAGNSQTITMCGYPMPTATFPTSEGPCPGSVPKTLETLNGAIEDACGEVGGCSYLDFSDIAGATATTWSALSTTAGSFHADMVHLNEVGYCKVAVSDKFRTRFACSVTAAAQSCFNTIPPPGTAPFFCFPAYLCTRVSAMLVDYMLLVLSSSHCAFMYRAPRALYTDSL